MNKSKNKRIKSSSLFLILFIALTLLFIVFMIPRYNSVRSSITKIPEFPWPPPKASAFTNLPSAGFKDAKTLGEVAKILDLALINNEYYDMSYYGIMPDTIVRGFAMATRLEQINKDGSSKLDPERWETDLNMRNFSFPRYLQSLFFLKASGHFRVIVFVVTDVPIVQSDIEAERNIAVKWVSRGANRLPHEISSIPFTESYMVSALIYEYENIEKDGIADLVNPSIHSGRSHLIKSKLWEELVN